MTQNKLEFLSDAFSEYKVEFSDDFTTAVILNPLYNENVKVYYEEADDYSPFITCFSFQHCHLCDEDEVVGWINDIITGKLFAIEFFKNDQRRFGGEIEAEELKDLSYEKLGQRFGYFGVSKLYQNADSFKVRGWNKNQNFDAVFVMNEDGTISIEKTYV